MGKLLKQHFFIESHEKFKTLYLFFHKACNHQSSSGVNKLKGCHLPSHMSLWSRGHVISCDEIKRYISTYTRLIRIKPDAVVTYGVGLKHVKWQGS